MTKLFVFAAAIITMLTVFAASAATASADGGEPVLDRFEITSTPGSDNTYDTYDDIVVTAVFDRIVTMKGNLQWVNLKYRLDNGSYDSIIAPYESGSGTNVITFTNTILDGQEDASRWGVYSGSFKVYSGNRKYTIHHSSIEHDDARTIQYMPEVEYVRFASSPDDGLGYRPGEHIEIDVEFNRAVQVDDSENIPFVMLDLDSGAREAQISGGIGTDTLRFRYTVRNLLLDNDLDGAGVLKGVIQVVIPVNNTSEYYYVFMPRKNDCDNHKVGNFTGNLGNLGGGGGIVIGQ